MNNLRQIVETYLKAHGINSKHEIEDILGGFDLTRPIYENRIWPGDKLFQFVRNYNSEIESRIGRWFCLQGASMSDLAIFSGGIGRQLTEFKVKLPIVVLEGTAKDIPTNWKLAIGRGIGGSSGGATQLFIPQRLFYSLEVIGIHYPPMWR